MLFGYLLWRLSIDDLKPKPFAFGHGTLSGIQMVCAVALFLYLKPLVRQLAEAQEHAS